MEDFKIIEIGHDLNEKNYGDDDEMAGKKLFWCKFLIFEVSNV